MQSKKKETLDTKKYTNINRLLIRNMQARKQWSDIIIVLTGKTKKSNPGACI